MDSLLSDLQRIMADKTPARGLGHDFYPYPAKMSPAVARFLIQHFSRPGDWILDPFMGGGTTVVEALAHGRKAIGVDLNAIAHLLTLARTTPLSPADLSALRDWCSDSRRLPTPQPDAKWDSLPHGSCLASLAQAADALRFPRRRRFAKAVLLKAAQWALDRRDQPPPQAALRSKTADAAEQLILALGQLTNRVSSCGVSRKRLTAQRLLLNRSALGLEQVPQLDHLKGAVDLLVTSPPYPGVHILYHRWQVRSRRETPAPYWVIGAQDGHGASHYTMGSRTPTGLANYFDSIQSALESVRPFLKHTARLCFLLAFRDPTAHLPLFLDAAARAGFEPAHYPPLWREVPNRTWYANRQSDHSAAHEVLLILHPSLPARAAPPAAPHATVSRSVSLRAPAPQPSPR